MIAWVAARADRRTTASCWSTGCRSRRLILGPIQIEAMIDQDTTISRQLSLWDQHGSRVLRGNLLVIPVGDAFLYVEPVYLEAEDDALPQLKRVIVSDGERLAMEPTLRRRCGPRSAEPDERGRARGKRRARASGRRAARWPRPRRRCGPATGRGSGPPCRS